MCSSDFITWYRDAIISIYSFYAYPIDIPGTFVDTFQPCTSCYSFFAIVERIIIDNDSFIDIHFCYK